MRTEAALGTLEAAPAAGRWRSLITQESVSTVVASVVIAAIVLLPLATMVVSSFRVMDGFGFSSHWGLDNYRAMVEDRLIFKAFINTLLISTGSTLLAT